MAASNGSPLRLLAAEIRGELPRIAQTVAEIETAKAEVVREGAPRLVLYGAAALLETFSSGVEKVLSRVGSGMGGLPEGPAWHRRLLEGSALDLPKIRPPILLPETVRHLEPYLAFRHRFRNLCLFDLESSLVIPLLAGVSSTWAQCRGDLIAFCGRLESIADALDQ